MSLFRINFMCQVRSKGRSGMSGSVSWDVAVGHYEYLLLFIDIQQDLNNGDTRECRGLDEKTKPRKKCINKKIDEEWQHMLAYCSLCCKHSYIAYKNSALFKGQKTCKWIR